MNETFCTSATLLAMKLVNTEKKNLTKTKLLFFIRHACVLCWPMHIVLYIFIFVKISGSLLFFSGLFWSRINKKLTQDFNSQPSQGLFSPPSSVSTTAGMFQLKRERLSRVGKGNNSNLL